MQSVLVRNGVHFERKLAGLLLPVEPRQRPAVTEAKWRTPLATFDSSLAPLVSWANLFSDAGFMPHGHCYLWNPALVWTHVTSDALIGLAYLAISLTLYALVRRIRLKFSVVVLCFGIFIGACGLTHFMEVWTLWYPDYWLSAFFKIVTAAASVFTGIYLFRLRQDIVDLANAAKLSEERKIELEGLNKNLESRVQLAAEKATEGQSEFKAFYEQAISGMFQLDLATQKFIRANRKFCELIGYSENELREISRSEVTHPDDLAGDAEKFEMITTKKISSFQREKRFIKKDGSILWVQVNFAAIYDAQGNPVRTANVAFDITERKEFDMRLEESELRFRTIANSIPQLTWMTDSTGFIVWYNQRWFDYTGTTLEEMQGWGWKAVHHPDHTERVTEKWLEHLKTAKNWEDTFPLRGKDGLYRWFLSQAQPVLDANGKVYRWFGTNTDITAQRDAENALQTTTYKLNESEHRFRTLTESLPQLIWTCLPDGYCDYLSRQWVEYTGVPEASQLGSNWLEAIHPEDRERTEQMWLGAVAARNDYDIEYRLKRHDGEYRWYRARGVPLRNTSGDIVNWFGSCSDTHEQRLLIDELERVSNRLTIATTSAEIGIWEWDLDSGLLRSNDIERRIYGFADETLHIDDFSRRHFAEDRKHVQNKINEAIEKKSDLAVEFRIHKADGTPAWVYGRGRAVYDAQGRATRMYGADLDITERKKTEERLSAAVKQANEANELKSAFLANMSHEIRTPLGAILGFTDLLQDHRLGQKEKESFHAIVKRNGEQLSSLINDILDLSKVEAGQFKADLWPTDIRVIVAEVCSTMNVKAHEKRLEYYCHTNDEVPDLVGTDPLRVKQILMNVIGNAIKFTHHGTVSVIASLESDGNIHFTITDTGIGLSKDQAEKLFQPFSQADPSITRNYGGTGLGLVLSRQLSRALGGDLILKSSTVAKGTVFEFWIKDQLGLGELNKASVEAKVDVQAKPHKSPKRSDELLGVRVLLVDDSPDNRYLISRILTNQGATVSEATNGAEGVDAAFGGEFDIVLLDIQMPIMDGYTATQKLREGGYRIPIIALTAHAMNEVRLKTLSVGCDDHMTKPLKADELILKVRRYTGRGKN